MHVKGYSEDTQSDGLELASRDGFVQNILEESGLANANWKRVNSGSNVLIDCGEVYLKIYTNNQDESLRELLALQHYANKAFAPNLVKTGLLDANRYNIIEKVQGVALVEQWPNLDKGQKEGFLERIGQMVAEIGTSAPKNWLFTSAHQWWQRNLSDPECTGLDKQLVRSCLSVEPPPANVFANADLKLDHLFVQPDGEIKCIDFGDAELAWVAYEAATVLLEICERSRTLFLAYQRGLGREVEPADVLNALVAHRYPYLSTSVPYFRRMVDKTELMPAIFI